MKKNNSKIKNNKTFNNIKKPLLIKFGLKQERNSFIENLSLYLAAGMDILTIMKTLEEESFSFRMKKAIFFIKEQIESGSSLWQAMDNTGIFDSAVITMVKIGEQSGNLTENLKIAAIQKRKEIQFDAKIRSAMTYPSFVLFVMVVVGLIMAWFVLPNLARAFASFDVELPVLTQALINLGNYIGNYGYILLPAVFFLTALIVFILFFFGPTKKIGQNLMMHIPGVKKIIMQSEMAKLGFVVGTQLNAGMNLVFAFNSLTQASKFQKYKELYKKIIISIENGNSFKKFFEENKNIKKLIPHSVQQLIIAGEQSGYLSQSLLRIGDIYEEKIDNTAKDLAVIIEPVLLFLVWIAVLVIALAVLMPIYNLSNVIS